MIAIKQISNVFMIRNDRPQAGTVRYNPDMTERIELLIDRRLLNHDEYGLTTAMPLSDGLTLNFEVSHYQSSKVLNKQHRKFNLQVYSGSSMSEVRGHAAISSYFSQRENLAVQLKESGISSFDLTRLGESTLRLRLDFFSDRIDMWKASVDNQDSMDNMSL